MPCSARLPASFTTPTSAERNGSTRLPSLEVPSANSTTEVPEARRCTISAMASPACWRRVRSTNTVRCMRAVMPTSGHFATSRLATKATGVIDPITTMSTQET